MAEEGDPLGELEGLGLVVEPGDRPGMALVRRRCAGALDQPAPELGLPRDVLVEGAITPACVSVT